MADKEIQELLGTMVEANKSLENKAGEIIDKIDEMKLEIAEEISLEDIIQALETHRHVFLTGKGGVGKTYMVKRIVEHYKNNVIITASTGAAALLVGGETVHSTFKLGVQDTLTNLKLFDEMNIRKIAETRHVDYNSAKNIYFYKIKRVLQYASLIVIDEVSMLSRQIIDMVFYRMEQFGYHPKILAVGDFLQLPPVSKTNETNYAFESAYWKLFKTFELKNVKRTNDPELIYCLNKIRVGKYTPRVKALLESKKVDEFPQGVTQLYALRKYADAVNKKELEKIDSPMVTSVGKFLKVEGATDKLKETNKKTFLRDMRTPHELNMKVGALIMFTVNDIDKMYVNGERAVIVGINEDQSLVRVLKEGGQEFEIAKHCFTKEAIRVEGDQVFMESVIEYMQFPFMLAWGVTIHKAQGATIENLGIDCKDIFENSQFYVAISRAKNSEKLYIKNFDRRCIKVSEKVLDFYESLETEAENQNKELE